ncbi:MAG TPA: O-antigen ligase family protein [Bryobacteraceae bacterium]|jgi:hypothetical protein
MIFFLIGATVTVFVRESWPLYLFCIGILGMLAAIACKRQLDRINFLPLLIPAFGLLQLVFSTTAYAPVTRVAVLKWFALAGVMLIAQVRLGDQRRREQFLDQFVLFSSLMAILCLLQLHTTQGKILWYFDSGYSDMVFGFFPSRNNYGQFVELALAAALWRALTDRRRGLWFGVAGALLYASAIASTSRGAAVLASVELLAVPGVVLWRSRRRDLFRAGVLYAGVLGLALAWTAVSGWDATWKRFREPDAYQGRREFTQSALQMAAAHPVLGNGLGTFPLVYPKYAKIDLPELVNFAHDDWAEFAADGGFVFAAFIFGLFALALPAMIRNPWGLGLLFVMIHAGIDYPFPRVAIAGWMFALLGAVKAADPQRKRSDIGDPKGWLVPAALAVCCAFAIVWCGRLGVADVYSHQANDASMRKAIRIVPDEAEYYLRLAQLTDSGAQPLLERALQLNPYDAETLIDLGLDAELRGEYPKAETSLLKAAELDSTWLPRWTLANYYFRRGDDKGFWTWTAKAAAIASERRDFIPLFKLASRMDSDPSRTLAALPDHPAPLRLFVTYLLESGDTGTLEPAATRLLACGTQGNDRPYVFWAIEGFLSHRQPDGAVHLWSRLAERGWIRRDVGAGFAEPPLESSLDWRYKDVDGVTRSLGGDGSMRFEFSGQQPEETGLLERYIPVRPGVKQRLEWRYRVEQISDEPGVEWEIDSLSGAVLASSSLQPAAQDRDGGVEFTPSESIVRIRLLYRRAPGTARIAGAVDLMPARVVEQRESAAL